MASYVTIVAAIEEACSRIVYPFQQGGDGRINSANDERGYLERLKSELLASDPTMNIQIAPIRFWYDLSINGLPIDLKLTNGTKDNAFSLKAIIYTLTGATIKRRMSLNEMWVQCKSSLKSTRDPMTEYHYLVVNKNTNKFIFRSLMDINTYGTNPSNTLQINWKKEFEVPKNTMLYDDKVVALLSAIQTSVKQKMDSMNTFASSDIEQTLRGERSLPPRAVQL